jgi:hypothetical protein
MRKRYPPSGKPKMVTPIASTRTLPTTPDAILRDDMHDRSTTSTIAHFGSVHL